MYFKKISYHLFILFLLLSCIASAQTFKTSQQKFDRVKEAYTTKWDILKADLIKNNFDAANFEICIRIFKNDKLVEVWLKSKSEKQYKLFKTYPICYYSGSLGPKRKEGDGQVPEGFYNVAVFNPFSNYYLSLGINYPNASDKIIGKTKLGGDIMIHGNCLSIGCIPITDTYIKELYVLAVEARNNGEQTIPISIFPAKMDEKGMNTLLAKYSDDAALLAFWKNLKPGYDYFESHKQLPKITVDKAGKYCVSQ